jgi:hypothetical protein
MLKHMAGVDQRRTGAGKIAQLINPLTIVDMIILQSIDVNETRDKLLAAS